MRLGICSSRLAGLILAITFVLPLSSCVRETSPVSPAELISPVTVRGYKSLSISLEVRNATGSITDSTNTFFPEVAYLTTVVSGYSSGFCVIEMSDRYHVSIATDTFATNAEVFNRKLTAKMPMYLRIDLRGFSGRITNIVFQAPFEATGLYARLSLRDSMGSERTSFRTGEVIDFTYDFLNKSNSTQQWMQTLVRPFGRFIVSKGDVVVLQSFGGSGLPSVEVGFILPGDSLSTLWRGVSPSHPLPPGQYVVKVEPTFLLEHYGYPAAIEKAFTIAQ